MSTIVMTPRQLAHLKASVRSIMHVADLLETRRPDLDAKQKGVIDQLIKACHVSMEEIRLVLDIEEIVRGPRRLLPPEAKS